MKRLSLQWRITIMTALLTCAACVLTNCLVGYTGMRYMDAIGSDISAFNATGEDSPQAFDPTKAGLYDKVTIVVNDAQESFGTTTWYITAGVTLLGGALAYFASGRALKPLRAFAAQVERVQPDNLSEIRLSEDVPTELQRCSASFNDMIARLGEGFSAQRQFTGNAAHELRTPLALMQAQIELFISEHSGLQPETAELLDLLQEQTERMSRMTKVLLEMSGLRSVPCEDDVELGPLSEEVLTDLAPLAENKGMALNCAGDALTIGSDTLLYRLVFNLVENADCQRLHQRQRQPRAPTSRGPGPGNTQEVPREHLPAVLSSRQIPQQGIRRCRTRASACLGDCSPTRRHGRGRSKFRERDHHARDPLKGGHHVIRLSRGPTRHCETRPKTWT